jgi:exodeoxyribonuclease V alpha subunit
VSNLNRELQNALNPVSGDATPSSRGFRDREVAAPDDIKPRARSPFPSKPRESLRTVAGEFRPGDKLIQLRNNYDRGLFNGDIGRVVAVDAEDGTLTADFDGEKHMLERGDFGDIAPAYAISIHKSQGSEYPAVIIVLLKAHFMMLQRNLLYTALTRGKKKVFIVGEPAAYAMAVRNSDSKQRCTHLREKLAAAAESR